MVDANSAINPLEYDGFDVQLRTNQSVAAFQSQAFNGYSVAGTDDTIVVDAKGAGLDEDLCEDSCLRAVNNFGMPMDMYLSTDIHSNFSRAFYAKQRTTPGDRTAAGYLVPDFNGTLNFKFKPSIFMRPRKTPLGTAVSAGAAPTSASPTATTDAGSNFGAADVGTYSYIFSAVYADGETLGSTPVTSASVAAGKSVFAALTYLGTPLYFNVFRSPVGTTTGHQFIGRIAPAGSTVSTLVDQNLKVPGSSRAYMLMHDPDVLVWRQLGSLIKYDLAVTTTSYQWLQLIYGGIMVMAPRKNIIIDNLITPTRN